MGGRLRPESVVGMERNMHDELVEKFDYQLNN
jgi:hypothetical protein